MVRGTLGVGLIVAVAVLLSACSAAPVPDVPAPPGLPAAQYRFPPAPPAPQLPVDPAVDMALRDITDTLAAGSVNGDALDTVAASGDSRMVWLVSDLLRFVRGGDEEDWLVAAFTRLSGVDPSADPAFHTSPWQSITNHLIAWDLPAPPGYREYKASVFLQVEPRWARFFADADSEIDWRLVSWGGVLIDDRPLGDREPCESGCIPALDDPALTDAAGGSWYPDDRIVFGVVVDGAAVAFPRNIMEIHEMVNTTIGGRRLGIPYCTLCGSAQAYLTEQVPPGVEVPVLRTSGLLSRSNKVMYDLRTGSVLDTFTGAALSGPLQDAGVTLPQVSVVASTWGAWKQAHPDTMVVAEGAGLGRDYPLDPLRGRDDNGPIFPVGPVDPRLPVQAKVLGVLTADGAPVAFDAAAARLAIGQDGPVTAAGVEVFADGGGLRARVPGGAELAAHEAFWFAWSQFHPDTALWPPP